jgi:hypothetical protein
MGEFDNFNPADFVRKQREEHQANQDKPSIAEQLMGKPIPKMKELPSQNTAPSSKSVSPSSRFQRFSGFSTRLERAMSRIGRRKFQNKKVLKRNNVILTLQSPQHTSLLSADSVFFSAPQMLQNEKDSFIKDSKLFFRF